MKILAIETSCDETAVAIVEDGVKVLANVIASQVDLHAKTGGVVPEVAAREHVLKMLPVLDEALSKAQTSWQHLDALAVTQGPGLISSLVIGTQTASTISYLKNIPLIATNHIHGHIYSNWLERNPDEIRFPLLVLTVSGGHNELVLMRGHYDFEILGETLDDAAGEAFDKVARVLDLGYPGGPAISKIATQGDPSKHNFPRPYLDNDSLDFSFSGLKTAVINEVQTLGELSEQNRADIAAGFQEAAVEVLAKKLISALRKYPDVREVHLAGGVSANTRLREFITENLPADTTFRFPKSISYCTDNAAMIATAAYFAKEKAQKKNNVVAEASFT